MAIDTFEKCYDALWPFTWTDGSSVEFCLQMIAVEKHIHINSSANALETQEKHFLDTYGPLMSADWKEMQSSPAIQTALQNLNLPTFKEMLYQKCLERAAGECQTHRDSKLAVDLPTHITVSGAGTWCVNGVYARSLGNDCT